MITREDKVEQSVTNSIRDGLATRGYDDTLVNIREAFPTPDERATPMTLSQLAIGFNFDDGGVRMELGSDLTMFTHTIEIWVFGVDQVTGRNIAHVCRQILYADDYTVPLLDISQDGAPQEDVLIVDKATVNRQISGSARPWDLYVYTCTARIEDTYSPSAEA